MATLLGVFNIKMFPMAARADPMRQKLELPSYKSNLSQTPPMTMNPPTIKANFIPYRFSNQLQGNAKKGCAIVNKSPFKVTYNGDK